MNKKSFLLLIIFSLTCVGCSKNITKQDISNDTLNTSADITADNVTISHYTGQEVFDEEKNNSPFMVMVENSVNSRPQSGLSFADIIYETLAEGGIPRFMALFHSEHAKVIGPVRSVRQYFIDLASENNLPFAHCGGSAEALSSISQNQEIMSINEISSSKYFWRDETRSAPHNLYTSSENILKSIKDNNFNYSPTSFTAFNENYYNKDSLTAVSDIKIELNRLYNTSYSYSDGKYIKSMDNELAIDAYTGYPLTFSNIVIQKTNIKLQEDNSHLNIYLIGTGEGYIFSNGRYVNVLWKKENNDSKTTFYDYDGNVVPLSPGKTIWHIVNTDTHINLN